MAGTRAAAAGASIYEWQKLSLLRRWVIASRVTVLVMTFNAAAIAGLLAALDGAFEPLRWTLCALGLLLAHATHNQINDLVDSRRGIDGRDSFRTRYGTHVLEHGLLSERQLLGYITVTGSLALLSGLLLVWLSGWPVLAPLLVGAACLLFYTYPIKQWGLGELMVLLVWGPLMIGGTYLAVTDSWSHQAGVLGLLCALGPSAVILGKHIDKRELDLATGVYTLPVRLGDGHARTLTIGAIWLQLFGIVIAVAAGWLPWPVLISLAVVPQALRCTEIYRRPAPQTPPEVYPEGIWPLWFAAYAFRFARTFGLLLLVGLALSLGVTML